MENTNHWQDREFTRMHNGTYTAVDVPGDDPHRFLHQSLDGTGRVAYTKDDAKGAADIQTVTTLEAYREKYGLELPVVDPRMPVYAPREDYTITLADKLSQYFDAKKRVIELKHELEAML